MATSTGTTRPSRSRAATTKPAAQPAKATKAAAPKAEAPADTDVDVTAEANAVEETQPEKVVVQLERHPDGDTKSYTRWVFPSGSGGTGTVYGPLGATEARVLFVL